MATWLKVLIAGLTGFSAGAGAVAGAGAATTGANPVLVLTAGAAGAATAIGGLFAPSPKQAQQEQQIRDLKSAQRR